MYVPKGIAFTDHFMSLSR